MPIALPTTSLSKLSDLRAREHLILIFWGCVRWLAMVASLYLVAVLVDFFVDEEFDTPIWLRTSLSIVQIIAAAVAGYFWIVRPMFTGPSLIHLARRVEKSIPEFDHRLITAIQLSRPDAQTQGMSPQLIQNVTHESEQIAGRHQFVKLADARRVKWGLGLLTWPFGIFAGMLIAFGPGLLGILTQRQLFANVDIPRDVRLQVATKKNPWPNGDEVTVRYDVASANKSLTKEMKGTVVYISDETSKKQQVDLVWDDRTEFDPAQAIFKAKIPQSSVNFDYRARLGDGRTGKADRVTFEARPQVTIDKVWVQAPNYIPDRPVRALAGKNIKAHEGSRARVRIVVQKPIVEANLQLYVMGDNSKEIEYTTLPMTILPPETFDVKGRSVTVYPAESDFFDLRPYPSNRYVAYRASVLDENRFANNDKSRGTIDITQPPEPVVKLIDERFTRPGESSSAEDFFMKGLPIPLGRSIKVEYWYSSALGARDKGPGPGGALQYPAYFVYRINDAAEGKSEIEQWTRLPLTEVKETAETGPYNFMDAYFANLDYQRRVLKDRAEFVAKPAAEAGLNSRADGGGFFDFEISNLRKKEPDGTYVPLTVGDKIEFYVEVYDRDPADGRPPGKSDRRSKTIATEKEVFERMKATLLSDQRIRELQDRQQGIFKNPQK